jgi:DNA-binding protein HU-beta
MNKLPMGKMMNKSELIDAMAAASDLTKSDAGKALDGFLEAVKTSLSKGESVALVGFGTFSVKERAERKGRNPQTGAEITIKAAKIPAFKAGKTLKDAVN